MTKARKTLVTALAVATLGIGAAGVGTTFAAQGEGSSGRFDNIVSAIATRFNLDEAEVREVFDEQLEEQHAAKMQERLNQAVTDGDLTQDKADAIIAKLEELKVAREAMKDLEPEEAREVMKENMDALREWAEENDIPRQFLPMPGHHRGHHGHGGFVPNGDKPAPEISE